MTLHGFKWLLIGISLTCFGFDYLKTKVEARELVATAQEAIEVSRRTLAASAACLNELTVQKATIESWEYRRRMETYTRVEVLQSVERAKDGDAEAIAALRDLGYYIQRPANRLVASTANVGAGIGGF